MVQVENAHHGGICPFCCRTSPFVPVEEARQPIQHSEDCQREAPNALEIRRALSNDPARQKHMRTAALGMERPNRGT